MRRLNLFGDSVIDNKQYVRENEFSVLEHLESECPRHTFDLHAVDGHTTHDVLNFQLTEVTRRPSVVSVGGNDLLHHLSVITDENKKVPSELLDTIHEICQGIGTRISSIVRRLEGPALICTIYNPDFLRDEQLSEFQKSSEVVIGVANDIIQAITRKAGKDVLELRSIFTSKEDFANPIEPSHAGGQKLARAILAWHSTVTG